MYDTKKPVGNGITTPVAASSEASRIMNSSLKHDGDITGSASNENLSAKFKYPKKHQEIPEAGKNQYE